LPKRPRAAATCGVSGFGTAGARSCEHRGPEQPPSPPPLTAGIAGGDGMGTHGQERHDRTRFVHSMGTTLWTTRVRTVRASGHSPWTTLWTPVDRRVRAVERRRPRREQRAAASWTRARRPPLVPR